MPSGQTNQTEIPLYFAHTKSDAKVNAHLKGSSIIIKSDVFKTKLGEQRGKWVSKTVTKLTINLINAKYPFQNKE